MFKPGNTILICPENDLESKTILKIARELGIEVRTSKQSWGARLENEPDENLKNPDKKDVWIVEIPGPEKEALMKYEGHNLSIIDHHEYKGLNRFNDLSSLEQFAKKCEYTLSEEEKLIVINDRSYIWGLIDAGASFDDIRRIRELDLNAQGWKEEDFKANKKEYEAVNQDLIEFEAKSDPIYVHETNLDKTGHLVDLFHMPDEYHYRSYRASGKDYKRLNLLLVKKGERITLFFSGKNICRDVVLKHVLPLSDNYWLGGQGQFGFAGFSIKSEHDLQKIRSAKKDILKELERDDFTCQPAWRLHNSRIEKFTSFFIFPFSYAKREIRPHGRWTTEPQSFKIPVNEDQLSKDWDYAQNYAEYIYFHDYVREFLFSGQANGKSKKNILEKKNKETVKFYEYKLEETPVIQLETIVKTDDKTKQKLKKMSAFINGIYMHIYPGEIGILVIETSNIPDTASEKRLEINFNFENNIISNGEDLLLFHNMFRRVYPAYFEKKDFKENDECGEEDKNREFTQIRNQEFPKSITIKALEIDEAYPISKTHLVKNPNGKYYPILSRHITKLLDVFFASNSTTKKHNNDQAPKYFPILDDRMLVYSYAAFHSYVKKEIEEESRDIFFSRFMYVDNSDRNYRYNRKFIRPLMNKHTYKRWEHYNIKIGFTRYSAAFQLYGHEPIVYRTFVSMYYQMFLLITYYRARLVRFSGEVADIADKWPHGEDKSRALPANLRDSLRDLHTRFMRFMNIHWFVEVSNQDQGIEIFQLMRKAFELEPLYKQVKDEIERADELVELIHNEKIERFNRYAGCIGIFIGVSAILTGFFGMNFEMIDGENGWGKIGWLFLIVLGIIVLFSPAFVYLSLRARDWFSKRVRRKRARS